MAKYDQLHEHLKYEEADPVVVGFHTIDALVAGGLPPSARMYRAWWSNGASSQSKAWLDAGREVGQVDLEGETVTFVPLGMAPGRGRPRLVRETPPMTVLEPQAEVTAVARWRDGGPVVLDGDGAPAFCDFGVEPMIYQLRFVDAEGHEAVYAGETGGAYGRLAQYRSGRGGSTNVRIHQEIRDCIEDGGTVHLLVCVEAVVVIGGQERPANLADGNDRRLIEAATIASYLPLGWRLLNLIVDDGEGTED